MKTAHSLPSRYALILDPAEIRKVLRKLDSLDLPRRECHPLDRYTGKKVSSDLARYDAAVDREIADDDHLIDKTIPESPRSRVRAEDDDLDDDWDA